MEGMILKYSTEPEVVEAVAVTVLTASFVAAWCWGSVVTVIEGDVEMLGVNVPTPDGKNMRAEANGDYVVKLEDGTFTVFHQAMFRKKYPRVVSG